MKANSIVVEALAEAGAAAVEQRQEVKCKSLRSLALLALKPEPPEMRK